MLKERSISIAVMLGITGLCWNNGPTPLRYVQHLCLVDLHVIQLSHHAIAKQAEQLAECRKCIADLGKEVRVFDSELPCDMEAAKKMLLDLQSELSETTNKIRSKIID